MNALGKAGLAIAMCVIIGLMVGLICALLHLGGELKAVREELSRSRDLLETLYQKLGGVHVP